MPNSDDPPITVGPGAAGEPPDAIGEPSTADAAGAATRHSQRRDVVQRLLQIVASMLLTALLLFGVAGTWRWPEAWLLVGLYTVSTGVAALVFAPRHPEVVAARSHWRLAEAPRWDRVIAVAWSLLSVTVPAVAGLEYRWQGPSAWPVAVTLVGAVGFVAAYALLLWSMAANPFFETVVRIQHERGHVTVTGGPYAYIRHPGYIGAMSVVLTMSLVLRSPWALAPALLGVAVILVRTALEDRFLQARLTGYQDYARRVRYRLVPGIW